MTVVLSSCFSNLFDMVVIFNISTKFPRNLGSVPVLLFAFSLGFLSRTFTTYRTAGEGGAYLFNSSLPLPLASILRYRYLDISRAITEERSLLNMS